MRLQKGKKGVLSGQMTDKFKNYKIPSELENTTLNDLYQALLLNGVSEAYAIVASLLKAELTFPEVWNFSDEGLRVHSVPPLRGDNLRYTNEAMDALILQSRLEKKST